MQDRKRTLRCYRSLRAKSDSHMKREKAISGLRSARSAVLVTPVGAGPTKAASQGWDESQPRGRGKSNESNTPLTWVVWPWIG
jgi:hypothetical protein